MWGRFREYPEGRLPPAAEKKKVAVIGGGPAGIEAMKWLLQRGHDVTLYEKSGRVGGHVRDAVAADFKNDLRDYLKYMEDFAANCGARVLLNTEATPEKLAEEHYDAVVAALGSDPILPRIPGSDRPNVHWAPDAENGKVPCWQRVVIVGGSSVGTEASISLAQKGKEVTVVEMAEQVDLFRTGAASDLLALSEENRVKRLLGWKLCEITGEGAHIQNGKTGEEQTIPADTVLMAVGMKPRRAEALKLAHLCPETSFYIIGDAVRSGEIRDAVFQAFEVTRTI
jgi:NADPH-dependent 2,4-dienoyl-CoA reductase/sulfur reductase-like enzyme